jgi:hypothetical protein
MTPFVHLQVDGERKGAARMLGYDDLGAACVEISDDCVAVERLISDQRIEGQAARKCKGLTLTEGPSRTIDYDMSNIEISARGLTQFCPASSCTVCAGLLDKYCTVSRMPLPKSLILLARPTGIEPVFSP